MYVGTRNQKTREDWLENALIQIPAGSRILDAGAGEQAYRRYCSHLNYVSQDFALYDGNGDGTGLQMSEWSHHELDIVSDITAIPEPSSSFDAIMCIEVLEHLPDPLAAFREFYRLLKPGGFLLLTAPFCSLTHFAPYYFHTGFSRYFFEKQLDLNGFSILDLQSNGNFFEYVAQETRRLGYIAERFSGYRLRLWERICVRAMLKILKKLSSRDQGSTELLNFGTHVLAVKCGISL